MASLKHHFINNFLTDFSEILEEDVKLMLNKVLKVLCRHLLALLSYRENMEGGIFMPPALCGLTEWQSIKKKKKNKMELAYLWGHPHYTTLRMWRVLRERCQNWPQSYN